MAELNAGQADATTRRATITGELATIAGRERRLLDALADGNGAAEAIRTRLRAELERRDTLTAELGQLETEAVVDTAALVRAATERAGDLRGLLARNIAQARQVVRQLLPAVRGRREPWLRVQRRRARIAGSASPSLSTSVVAPRGSDRRSVPGPPARPRHAHAQGSAPEWPRLGGTGMNCGHGHMGWIMACGTARIVADLMTGRMPELDLEGLVVRR